jgi:PAS domain S-box-containing protein
MPNANILIVEDEAFFARNIEDSLKDLGYGISAIVDTGEAAIKEAENKRPDLVLMDIVLKGEMDGVEAADEIHARLDIPVIYLTGVTGEEILQRAKTTEPFGYMLKPFQERELNTSIELAIYKHKMEKRIKESEGKLSAMLQSIGDHMCMVDNDMNIIWANDVAKEVFGSDIVGKKCCEVYHHKKEPCSPEPCLSIQAFKNGEVHRFESKVITKEGETLHFSCSANIALRNKEGTPISVLQIARDITDNKKMEEHLKQRLDEVERLNKLMVGRELKMGKMNKEFIRLKARIEELEGK